MKANIRAMCYTPTVLYPPLAQQLVAYESIIKNNLTVDAIQAASAIGIDNTVIPGTLEPLTEWLSGVLCSDILSLYNQTFADLSSHVRTLQAESFLAGELWSTLQATCTGWPIQAKMRFAGKFNIVRTSSRI